MKAVILAGGRGTRINEETYLKPKPMIEIGGLPILVHIMNIYSSFGFNEFIICAGYKQEVIKEYFANYFLRQYDVEINFADSPSIKYFPVENSKWKITIVDTGLDTMTGGRVKRIAKYLNGEDFLLTYGDGVSDIDINELVKFHNKNNKLLTITAVQPEERFGNLVMSGDIVKSFSEKQRNPDIWVNGGFMVCKNEILKYIDGDASIFEKHVMPTLAQEGNLCAFKHNSFWKCMDTLKDKDDLEQLWSTGNAPWKK